MDRGGLVSIDQNNANNNVNLHSAANNNNKNDSNNNNDNSMMNHNDMNSYEYDNCITTDMDDCCYYSGYVSPIASTVSSIKMIEEFNLQKFNYI